MHGGCHCVGSHRGGCWENDTPAPIYVCVCCGYTSNNEDDFYCIENRLGVTCLDCGPEDE